MIFGLVLAKWLHWTACILLASPQFFRVCLLPQKGPMEGQNVQIWRDKFLFRLGTFAQATWMVALLSLLVWFGVTAWNMTSLNEGIDLSLISAVAVQTQFGHVSTVRFVVLVFAGACLFTSHRPATTNRSRVLRSVTIAVSTLNVLSLALVGHATATPGPTGVLHLAIDTIHLAAASVWPGGLVFFALLLRSTIALPSSDLRMFAVRATYRFSTSSLLAVVVLSTTGLATSFFFIHDVHDIWRTTYGQLLTGKVLLFFGIVAMGAYNLLVLIKRKFCLEAHSMNVGRQTFAAQALFHNVLWEVALGAMIILMVAVLGMTEPPRH